MMCGQSSADLDDPAATCWVKMSDVGIEGLRQAFLDPGSRIRLHSDPSIEEHAELVAMAWEGGFLRRGRWHDDYRRPPRLSSTAS